jgi:hypothetical protein
VLRAGAQHLFDVDLISGPALELSPRHMANYRGVGIADRPQQPLGLRFSIELESAVDARNHEVELVEHLVRIVQRAVGEDVGLDALQDPEVFAELLVQAVRFAVLVLNLFDGEQPIAISLS